MVDISSAANAEVYKDGTDMTYNVESSSSDYFPYGSTYYWRCALKKDSVEAQLTNGIVHDSADVPYSMPLQQAINPRGTYSPSITVDITDGEYKNIYFLGAVFSTSGGVTSFRATLNYTDGSTSHVDYNANNGNLIFATIAMGVISGIGFSLQIKRHGSSGGTYAISSLIKHWNPAANIAWLSFAMDSCVVILVLFTSGKGFEYAIEMAICTMTNLFISNIVVDYCMQGSKEGYKFEIITDDPEKIAQEVMGELKHGVTELRVQGMYTHEERHMIVCIIRKRELSKMMKILKKYPRSFASFARVNEVFGNFKR